MLKQTCTMLEGQVEELEVMNDEYQDREDQWNLLKYVLLIILILCKFCLRIEIVSCLWHFWY